MANLVASDFGVVAHHDSQRRNGLRHQVEEVGQTIMDKIVHVAAVHENNDLVTLDTANDA